METSESWKHRIARKSKTKKGQWYLLENQEGPGSYKKKVPGSRRKGSRVIRLQGHPFTGPPSSVVGKERFPDPKGRFLDPEGKVPENLGY